MGFLPGPPYATQPERGSGQMGGGGDPRRLKPPVGSFSQSHAGRAPCLKSHGYLSGLGMEGGGRMGGETILTVIDAL